MFYYTYVLKCADGKLYIGSTSDIDRRLREHKKGLVHTTSRRLPGEFIYYEACKSKKSATDREKYFKTGFGRGFIKKRTH